MRPRCLTAAGRDVQRRRGAAALCGARGAGRAAVNIAAASFYGVFLYSAVRFFLRTGSPVGLGLVIFNTILMACLLARRPAKAVSGSPRNWLLAALAQVVPFFLRPVAGTPVPLALVSAAGELAGLCVMVLSLLALNRSIGIVAANRGIRTSGPYAWVRHPLYAGEITFLVGFVLGNLTVPNLLLVSLLVAAQVARATHEETLLLVEPDYQRYRVQVAYRMIPGIF
jgi:protein-S-isoprenylcysteine O-methyltransferase Ste14